MMLSEGVHYETIVLEPGRWIYEGAGGVPWGLCSEIVDGKAIVLRRTHPDVSHDEIENLGKHQRRMRSNRNKRIDSAKGHC